ncbi:glycosyltransferase (plasmid) [Thioclava sp. 'Guangxiensis']|uniref:glycosyltransferase n=1 Tax=Thioclava sp. 'Guangxiensis' TaxID=3149044 RepID=UPI0038778FC6
MITLRSLQALWIRYSSLHRIYRFRPRRITAADGTLLGWLEVEEIHGNRHHIRGWVRAEEVVMTCGEAHRIATRPDQHRADVEAAHGGDGRVGFALSLPLVAGPGEIRIRHAGGEILWSLRQPGPVRRLRGDLRLAGALLWAGLRGLPAMRTYRTSPDPAARDAAKAQLKALLRLAPPARNYLRISEASLGLLPEQAAGRELPAEAAWITIVLPVYNAFDLLQDCLARILRHTDTGWHLVLIEDCSPDPAIRPFLRDWAADQGAERVTLLENDTNLGFIGSVNRGFAAALERGDPVVLLNSDALVPEGWARRLIAPLADPDVASVTPMCNDAEILNTPVICRREVFPEGQEAGIATAIDRAARTCLAQAPAAALPTGVGFCMAIAPAWLARVPAFDTVFGRGYGEEVDWCRKTMAQGGRHLGLPGLFVEHRGGESFGSEEKRRLIAANGQRITERYPRFDAEVQDFIAGDPLIGPRMLLGLAWAAAQQSDPLSVYVVHSLGGGAEDAMRRDIAALCEAGQAAVVLQLGGTVAYRMELHSASGVTSAELENGRVLMALLGAVERRRVIYICGVGDARPETLPARLLEWTGEAGELIIEIHDFFPLSPSYTLLDAQGRYTGIPRPATHGGQICHQVRDAEGAVIDLGQWQAGWHAALAQARIITFSRDSGDIVAGLWPDLAPRIEWRPHAPLLDVPQITRTPARPVRTIGVLGNIGYQKGAQLLQLMAQELARSGAARLVVMGNIDPNYPLHGSATIHGSYARAEIALLAESYGIDCWLIPSIWPETFSFTTREALATGLPVWCFDLGAQAEALREAGQGARVLPLPQESTDMPAILSRILAG